MFVTDQHSVFTVCLVQLDQVGDLVAAVQLIEQAELTAEALDSLTGYLGWLKGCHPFRSLLSCFHISPQHKQKKIL